MVELKLVINDVKKGKSYPKPITEEQSQEFMNLKLGNKIKGDNFGFSGYEFEIKGGTDNAGFPMRRDLDSAARKKALLTKGPGIHIKRKGMRKRKTIRGNTISESTSQVNLKILAYGKEPLEKVLGIEEKPKEESTETKKEEPVKEETKTTETKEVSKEETKKEPEKKEVTSKEEPKTEEKKEPEKPKEEIKKEETKTTEEVKKPQEETKT